MSCCNASNPTIARTESVDPRVRSKNSRHVQVTVALSSMHQGASYLTIDAADDRIETFVPASHSQKIVQV
jgi:hypothetical protein